METSYLAPSVILETRSDAETLGLIQPVVVLSHSDLVMHSSLMQPRTILEHDAAKAYFGFLRSVTVMEETQPPPPFRVGDTLGYRNDTWSNDPTSYKIRWLRNGVPITDATGATYLIPSADEGATLAVEVTAVNSAGSSAAVVSEYVGPIETNTIVV